jgi:hypothetical protein
MNQDLFPYSPRHSGATHVNPHDEPGSLSLFPKAFWCNSCESPGWKRNSSPFRPSRKLTPPPKEYQSTVGAYIRWGDSCHSRLFVDFYCRHSQARCGLDAAASTEHYGRSIHQEDQATTVAPSAASRVARVRPKTLGGQAGRCSLCRYVVRSRMSPAVARLR